VNILNPADLETLKVWLELFSCLGVKNCVLHATNLPVPPEDRDVLENVDKIVEIKDGRSDVYRGGYADYLRANASRTANSMNEYETVQRKIENLTKKIEYAKRNKSKWTGTADKRNPFVVMETHARKEKEELEKIAKPSFWVDEKSAREMNPKNAARYEKYKAKNLRLGLATAENKSRRVIIKAENLSVGYNPSRPLFADKTFQLFEHDILEIKGRNGAGKTTLIRTILGRPGPEILAGSIFFDSKVRVGIYDQEFAPELLELTLHDAIEKVYGGNITETKIRGLMANYLFDEADVATPVERLSGGQKARLQLIKMLANDPQLLVLDEPTSHLDLMSIEELENALRKYSGAILYVSHDNYFRRALGGATVEIP
jgi:ATPase subunit of ABC transporter with duplicated ATPase domains